MLITSLNNDLSQLTPPSPSHVLPPPLQTFNIVFCRPRQHKLVNKFVVIHILSSIIIWEINSMLYSQFRSQMQLCTCLKH